MGRLTTHVLDTAQGRPGGGIRITLHRNLGERYALVADAVTNADGRCDRPLLEGDAFTKGRYRLVFAVGEYFAASGLRAAGSAVRRRGRARLRRRRRGCALPRAAARVAVELVDVPGQLTAWKRTRASGCSC